MGNKTKVSVLCEKGSNGVEYALISALIALTIFGAVAVLGNGVGELFELISSTVNNAVNASG